MDYPIVTEYRNDNYEYSRFTVGLLKNDNDTEFAKKLSDKLIEAMNQDYLYNNFEGLWSVLLEKYFLVVWEDFSKALVSKDYIRFRYQVRHEIGSGFGFGSGPITVSYTHLRAHETVLEIVCRLLLEKKMFHMIDGKTYCRSCVTYLYILYHL